MHRAALSCAQRRGLRAASAKKGSYRGKGNERGGMCVWWWWGGEVEGRVVEREGEREKVAAEEGRDK